MIGDPFLQRMGRWFVAAAILAGGSSCAIADDAAPAKVLRAGALAIDITPEQLPVLVNGGMTTRSADKIVDRLHARCLVLDDGANQIAIVVVDSCMMPRSLLDEAKEVASQATGIPTSRMLISATHTHSAPSTMGALGTDADPAYVKFLPDRIARGIALAQQNLEPARIGWASEREPKNIYCRHWLMKEGTAQTNPFSGKANDQVQMNPGNGNPNKVKPISPVDDEVSVVSIQAKDGRPIALLANYSTHYAGSPALSADYFGVFAEKIEKLITPPVPLLSKEGLGEVGEADSATKKEEPPLTPPEDRGRNGAVPLLSKEGLGEVPAAEPATKKDEEPPLTPPEDKGRTGNPAFVGIMSNGTSGDANCLDFSLPEPRKFDYFSVAEDTAQVAFKAYQSIKYYDWVPIVMEEGLLTLNVRMPTADEVAKAKEFLQTDEGKKLQTIPAVYARETVLLSKAPPTRELKIQAIRLGELGIGSMPNEVFGITGLTIKKESPLQRTFCIELANGAEGYIPPPDQHKLGGYTTWRARSSLLEEEAEPKIRAKVLELLSKIAEQRKDEAAIAASGERQLPESGPTSQHGTEQNGAHHQGANAPRSPVSPEDSLKYFHLRPGMKIELVAAEPLVRDPVAFDWGPDGKLWVVEYLDYPTGIDGKGKGGGRVVYLEDTNGDGRYDKSTVFIDGLNFPTGVMAWRGGVLITAAPHILFAQDTDGDGKADLHKVPLLPKEGLGEVGEADSASKKDEPPLAPPEDRGRTGRAVALYTGFHEANQQLRVNGLRWGLDNWIYCASGSHHGDYGKEKQIKSAKTGKSTHVGSRDFRIRPDDGLIEPTSGPSQFGRNRDAWGNWFGVQNAKPMWHYVLDDRYLRRNPHVAPPPSQILLSDVPGQRPVFAVSQPGKFHHASQAGRFTSANSAMIYNDELLGKEFIGNSFVSEPVHNLVHREIVERDGVTFKSHKPADEVNTEFLASEDTWFRPTTIRTGPDGALYIADMYREIIEHPQWVSDDLKPLVDTRSGTDRGRIYRIYPEDTKPRPWPRLDKLSTGKLVAQLESPSATLRDMVQMEIATRKLVEAKLVLEITARASTRPATRLQSLCTLDGLGVLEADMIEHALKDESPWVRREAVRLLESRETIRDALAYDEFERTETDPVVQLQLACSLGQWDANLSGPTLLRLATKRSDNPFIMAGVASSLRGGNLDWIAGAAADDDDEDGPRFELLKRVIATAVGEQRKNAITRLARRFNPRDSEAFQPWQLRAIAVLNDELAQQQSTLEARLEGARDKSELLASNIAAYDFARKVIGIESTQPALRIAAIELLGSARKSDDLDLLASQLTPRASSDMQHAVIQMLANSGNPRIASLLLADWNGHAPQTRLQILDVLLSRSDLTSALLEQVRGGKVAARDIDAARRQRLLQSGDARIRVKAEQVFAGGVNEDRAKVLTEYQPVIAAAASAGDTVRGKEVFAKRCSACHKVDGVGNEVGADLGGLTDKSPANLLVSILDPNRAVEPKFVSYTAVLTDGRVLSGMLADESGGSLTLLDADGRRHVLLRKDIEELKASGKSLMPEGLEQDISPEQMTDLIAYLQTVLKTER